MITLDGLQAQDPGIVLSPSGYIDLPFRKVQVGKLQAGDLATVQTLEDHQPQNHHITLMDQPGPIGPEVPLWKICRVLVKFFQLLPRQDLWQYSSARLEDPDPVENILGL